MATQGKNLTTTRTLRRVLASLPILIVMLSLVSVNLFKNSQDSRQPPDMSHVQLIMAKRSAWLSEHPLLLKVSQINIAGLPGEVLSDTCWHLVKTVSGHPKSQARVSKHAT